MVQGEIEPTDEEREAEKIDDGGSGLKDVYRAMASMTPAERKWQGAREKEKGAHIGRKGVCCALTCSRGLPKPFVGFGCN